MTLRAPGIQRRERSVQTGVIRESFLEEEEPGRLLKTAGIGKNILGRL